MPLFLHCSKFSKPYANDVVNASTNKYLNIFFASFWHWNTEEVKLAKDTKLIKVIKYQVEFLYQKINNFYNWLEFILVFHSFLFERLDNENIAGDNFSLIFFVSIFFTFLFHVLKKSTENKKFFEPDYF